VSHVVLSYGRDFYGPKVAHANPWPMRAAANAAFSVRGSALLLSVMMILFRKPHLQGKWKEITAL
jgi:hypothetical protein